MADAPKRVLVTRPEPGASQTARRLDALGFRPLKLPLHEIRPLPAVSGAVPDAITAVAATSANAIRHAPAALLDRLSKLPCFAVGEATAAIARDAGFSNVVDGEGDAE
ncbi:MAG: uroporphyrinogen-III synthase, partial [Pseudomonadota bacterium]|nr:uroporphyrinogen-III synthase [Pseudomonadota bacterium]